MADLFGNPSLRTLAKLVAINLALTSEAERIKAQGSPTRDLSSKGFEFSFLKSISNRDKKKPSSPDQPVDQVPPRDHPSSSPIPMNSPSMPSDSAQLPPESTSNPDPQSAQDRPGHRQKSGKQKPAANEEFPVHAEREVEPAAERNEPLDAVEENVAARRELNSGVAGIGHKPLKGKRKTGSGDPTAPAVQADSMAGQDEQRPGLGDIAEGRFGKDAGDSVKPLEQVSAAERDPGQSEFEAAANP